MLDSQKLRGSRIEFRVETVNLHLPGTVRPGGGGGGACDCKLLFSLKPGLTLVLFRYRKISILSPGLIFVQKAVLLGLFSGELVFGWGYY